MGTGKASGENAAYEAAKAAIESPLLDNISIDGAKGVLVHFYMHPDYPLMEISEAMEIIQENADADAYVIFGTTTDASYATDEIKITVIATGFEEKTKTHLTTDKKVEPQTLFNSQTNGTNIHRNSSKIVNGYNLDDDDLYNIPTFLRKQMD